MFSDPQGNLMSVKIVQSEFIQQRFLNDFMGKQKWFDAHPFREPSKAARQVAVDEDGTSVAAITRDVRDVVVAIDDADAVSDGAHRVQQHVVFDYLQTRRAARKKRSVHPVTRESLTPGQRRIRPAGTNG
jgi:hypothetical protein